LGKNNYSKGLGHSKATSEGVAAGEAEVVGVVEEDGVGDRLWRCDSILVGHRLIRRITG
jgi:hypothetical protein